MTTSGIVLPWSGAYVGGTLGVRLSTSTEDSLLPVEALVGLALRRNPKRAHLLVSRVLAKHVPTEPGIATAAGWLLALLVRAELQDGGPGTVPLRPVIEDAAARLGALLADGHAADSPAGSGDTADAGRPRPARLAAVADLCDLLAGHRTELPDVATIGYAETATGLGHLVAGMLGSYYIHSTRHAATGADAVRAYGAFEEAHSHASSHLLLPTSHASLNQAGTVVLVDDELSTGATIISTIRELHRSAPHGRYIVASLVDLRSAEDRKKFDALAAGLGCQISVVALAHGSVELPEGLPAAAAELIGGLPVPHNPGQAPGRIRVTDLAGAVPPLRSARFGVAGHADPDLAAGVAAALAAGIAPHERVLVLATEEFMAVPLAAAVRLQELRPDAEVLYSTSTRSPIAALDEPGYAIRSMVAFTSHDATVDGPGPRFAYNIAHPGGRFGTVLLMAEPGTREAALTGPGSIADAVAGTGADVHLVLLPREAPFPVPLAGPGFSSYAPQDVSWLLKDLSFASLEAPDTEREASIQSGRASYAESLPVEYEPTPEYQALFRAALDRSATRLARDIGVVTEQVLKLRGGAPVLVSLARAGTPVGILMKRWARAMHGLELPHYTMSIVRGLGMDRTALRYLAAHHRPEQIMFVDGWTGKGAIARELAAAVGRFEQSAGAAFSPELAVLADPGHCVRIFGTREDYLIPSACLNSTVSGLVSRTVFNTELIRPGDFHGAKFYSGLSGNDVSRAFLAAVEEQFAAVRDEVLAAGASFPADGRALPDADWSGWAAVEDISRRFGINNMNLVKPGVGETTRVLLRRIPWKVLVRPDAAEDVAHILLLAAQRGVEVLEVPELPYSCVGLIHPLDIPGAAGADGKTVTDV
ncbi:phosphoribosyltransferase domain-containing protein [Arthrobacter cavernae]|uniref:Phosphoribosyltransferase domain-containing protein n=1 Tax=Arthrobacter cavernae TaxID=2817681 RepID=A0A939KMJ8_9MICC|nr:phosphoribosyltransferase domain-containing protein [Arthrobacter cavernae]MBO1268291.1 phosphoribosyltransferase domain-containing protein [Arthrobacter cavernae]